MEHMIFLDLETTGLDPNQHAILEVAALYVQADAYGGLHQKGKRQYLIHPGGQAFAKMDEVVSTMHQNNGLIADVKQKGQSLASAETDLVKWAKQRGDKPLLCGASIQFDRAFIKRQMPKFDALLHYRMIDVSSLYAMLKTLGYTKTADRPGDHRAMADLMESYRMFQYYRKMLALGLSETVKRMVG